MGLMIELKLKESVRIGDAVVTFSESKGPGKTRLYIEAPRATVIHRLGPQTIIATNGSNDPTTKEKGDA